MQMPALYIFLIWSAITAAIFVYVGTSGSNPGELNQKAYKRVRAGLFVGLVVASVAFLWLTLPLMPYPDENVTPDRVIYVSAKQFAFKMSDQPISREDALNDEVFLSIEPIKVGELIEFRASTADVTHGFGVYGPRGNVLTQTQAMSGYVNRLRYRFPEPGTYPILCLEFCGIGHHTMKSKLDVVN